MRGHNEMQITVQCTLSHGHICKNFINAGYDLQYSFTIAFQTFRWVWGKGCTVMKALEVLHIIYYIPTFHQLFCLVDLYVTSRNTYNVTMGPNSYMLPNLPFWRLMTDIKTDPTDIGCNDMWWLELSLDCAEHMVSTVRRFSQKVNHNNRPLTKTWEM